MSVLWNGFLKRRGLPWSGKSRGYKRGGTSVQRQGIPFIPVYRAVQRTIYRKLHPSGKGLFTFHMRVQHIWNSWRDQVGQWAPCQMDWNFQTLLRNKDSFIARSLLLGLRPMDTKNVLCRHWKRAPKSLDLKGNPFDRKFKTPLATIMLCPTQWQSKPWTSLHWEESYVGNYLKA